MNPKVTVAPWLIALLVVVMMLQHYTRVVPFPEGAPVHSADLACRPDQLQYRWRWIFFTTTGLMRTIQRML